MGVDALDIGIKLKILKKQGKPSTQRWLLGELRKDGLRIGTLEGTMTAQLGDYIIRGVNGEFYPCKPDIFVDFLNSNFKIHNLSSFLPIWPVGQPVIYSSVTAFKSQSQGLHFVWVMW